MSRVGLNVMINLAEPLNKTTVPCGVAVSVPSSAPQHVMHFVQRLSMVSRYWWTVRQSWHNNSRVWGTLLLIGWRAAEPNLQLPFLSSATFLSSNTAGVLCRCLSVREQS